MQATAANLLLAGVGTLPQNPQITSVATDSRAVQSGSLFVCIEGEKTDGHRYAAAALKDGAVGIVAQHAVAGVSAEQTVLVENPLDAMIAIGGNYRTQYTPCLVGVTGSVGKTTTKEFCHAVFSAFGKTLKTDGNANNEIGVPRTLLRLDESIEYAVVEMGMQGMGEIEKLTLTAKPAGAIITCIGVSHLEQLGTRANILKAKMEICDGMTDGAPLVLNGDDEYLMKAQIPSHVKPVYFGIKNLKADVTAREISGGPQGTRFTLQDRLYGSFAVSIPAMGLHNVRNALSAYTLATRLGLDAKEAAAALSNYRTTGHRQNMVVHDGVTVIEDCYNASPDSMRAALETLAAYPANGRRVAVLGDMFELGSITQQAHREVGDLVGANSVSFLLTVGEAMRFAHARAQSLGVPATHCATKDDALALLKNYCRAGDVVLVKASHGMAFETILEGFYGKESV
ncbi:MAG: UDP-N-acetylmuramoyl-tripeptide--D-alanyl-D-alanine ligase [Ruthenibacterium sp.]